LNKTSVFSKTGKGVLHLKHRSPPLPQALLGVLCLIDGKTTLADLMARTELCEAEFYVALKVLNDDGFIREVAISVVAATPFAVATRDLPLFEGDLDFTRSLGACEAPFKSKA